MMSLTEVNKKPDKTHIYQKLVFDFLQEQSQNL